MQQKDKFLLRLQSAKNSRLSLTEALYKLDLTGEAFSRVDTLSKNVNDHQATLSNIQNYLAKLVAVPQMNKKFDEQKRSLDEQVSQGINEATLYYQNQLESKADNGFLLQELSRKCSWTAFNKLSAQVLTLQTTLDKHINADYSDLATKVKILRNSQPMIIPDDDLKGDVDSMFNKVITHDRQIKELLEAFDSIEEDCTEEMARLIEELERKILEERPAEKPQKLRRKREVPEQVYRSILVLKRELDQVLSDSSQVKKMYEEAISSLENAKKDIEALNHANDQHLVNYKKHQEFIKKEAERCDSLELKINKISNYTEKSFEKIDKDLEDKRLLFIENNKKFEKFRSDWALDKQVKSDKLNDFGASLDTLNQAKALIQQSIEGLTSNLIALEKRNSNRFNELKEDVDSIKVPMTNVISNQQNEIQAITGELKRKQEEERGKIEQKLSRTNMFESSKESGRVCDASTKSRMCTPSPTPGLRRRYKLKNREVKISMTPMKSRETDLKI